MQCDWQKFEEGSVTGTAEILLHAVGRLLGLFTEQAPNPADERQHEHGIAQQGQRRGDGAESRAGKNPNRSNGEQNCRDEADEANPRLESSRNADEEKRGSPQCSTRGKCGNGGGKRSGNARKNNAFADSKDEKTGGDEIIRVAKEFECEECGGHHEAHAVNRPKEAAQNL